MEHLLQEPVLKLPDVMKPFSLQKYASGVAAVLLQENEGLLYAVVYTSKKLSLAEAKYPVTEKECRAAVWDIRLLVQALRGKIVQICLQA